MKLTDCSPRCQDFPSPSIGGTCHAPAQSSPTSKNILQRDCLTNFKKDLKRHQTIQGTGTRDLIWLKVVSLERS